MFYLSQISCSTVGQLDLPATCLAGQNSLGNFVEVLVQQLVEFDSLTFGVAVASGGLMIAWPECIFCCGRDWFEK